MSVEDGVYLEVLKFRRPNGSLDVKHVFHGKSLTQQSHAEACDINNIMRKWLRGGPPPVSDAARAVFKDVSSGLDYADVLHRAMDAKASFMSLPSDMRARFKNDPAQLLDFISNPANLKEGVSLGLIDEDLLPKVNQEVVDKSTGEVKSSSEQ